MSQATPPPGSLRWTKRRRRSPYGLRVVLTPFVWIIGVPLTKAFARRWSRGMSRGMTRFMSAFPAYEPMPHDVFVCAYFKSGTNWTLQIATQIAYRGRAQFEHIHDVVPWPDVPVEYRQAVPLAHEEPRVSAPTGLRVIKTHLPLERPVPYSPRAHYICVVRDPKDVFVSGYHFTRAAVAGPLMPSVKRWLDAYLSSEPPLGSWAEHLQSCWELRHRQNVLFLTYEAMRADLPGVVDKIAAVMGVALKPAERAAVIEQSSFAHMKRIEHKFDPPGAPWASTRGAMLRQGKGGKSADLLSSAQQRRIDDYWRAELVRLKCDFPYDAAFGPAPATAAPGSRDAVIVDPVDRLASR